jgi:hypothetical protein
VSFFGASRQWSSLTSHVDERPSSDPPPKANERRAGVTRSTMMGFPCLRLDGDFFASCDHRTGELVVKLNEERATALVDAGKAEPFSPNGRRFREWVAVPHRRHRSWQRLLEEALELAAARGQLRESPTEGRHSRG